MQTLSAKTPPESVKASNGGTDGECIALDTRFGRMEFDRQRCLTFPSGLVGFGSQLQYGLVAMPNEKLAPLMILQSIDEPSLAFVVRPYDPATQWYKAKDIEEAIRQRKIAPEDSAVLLVTNFHRRDGQLFQSVNLRAPLLLDSTRLQAWQDILPNDSYSVRFML
ncbi:MAG: flagellar assembly protein FliW [Kiloniellales bacterium]